MHFLISEVPLDRTFVEIVAAYSDASSAQELKFGEPSACKALHGELIIAGFESCGHENNLSDTMYLLIGFEKSTPP